MSVKSDKTKFLLCVLFFVVLAAITFRCVFGENMVFSASDLNIGQLAARKNHLPASLTGYYTANQVLGGSGFSFTFLYVLLALFPLMVIAKVYYALILLIGSSSMVWYLRIWKRSWLAAVFGALVAFWVNSILLAHVGHVYKMEVLAFSVLSLCFVEKTIEAVSTRKAVGFSILAGLSVGTMMIEQQDVALLAGLFVGSYAVFRLMQVHMKQPLRWVCLLISIGLIALLLSSSTLLRSYKHNIAGAATMRSSAQNKWDYVTQWSAVPDEWPDLIALGWSGWSTGNPKGPYWGKLGRSAEWERTGKGFHNFKLNSVYFGIIPFLLGGLGLMVSFRNRKEEEGKTILFWSIAGLLGFWLAFGKYSLLYKLFYHLPLVNNIRAPIKFLDNFQICLAIVAAYGLDWLLANGKRSKPAMLLWIIGIGCGSLMLLEGLHVSASPVYWMNKFASMGFEPYAKTLVQCMSNAWLHAGVLAVLCGGLALAAWKGIRMTRWIAVGFIILMAADSLILTGHHFHADDVSSMKRGNDVINYLAEHQGDDRVYFVDQSGIYNQWVGVDVVYHGLNMFNIWQMPRMPVDYKNFLSIVGRNQIRLWQLSAVKYVAAPSGVLRQLKKNPRLGSLFEVVLNYQVPTAQGMRPDVLLEFKKTIPRFALFHGWETVSHDAQCEKLVSPEHNVLTSVLVDSDSGLVSKPSATIFQPVEAKVTKKKATISVQTKAEALLRFSQHYQPGWRVFVDGKAAKLLRVDYLCMGVSIPPGKHVVEFRCVNGAPEVFFSGGVFIASLVLAVVLLRRPRGVGA